MMVLIKHPGYGILILILQAMRKINLTILPKIERDMKSRLAKESESKNQNMTHFCR